MKSVNLIFLYISKGIIVVFAYSSFMHILVNLHSVACIAFLDAQKGIQVM